uniref:carboxypeptidase-like regulatory domain-containing protein n=1 Tax=uncultured Dysgonomonas sp. TaxID=206096 RepID=UPI00260B1CBA|nr:carboxypeptidase-like regulatory domain-containing protein [uncultured Dysgonomonas sp.]
MKAKLGIILVLLCVVSFYIYDSKDIKKTKQQEKVTLISGKIVNAENGQPVKDVAIAIQGTNPQSLSNAEGEYIIQARGDQELVFKHPKYKSLVITAKDAKAIKMEATNPDDIKRLQEDFEKAK